MEYKIALLPGDGIGPEITAQAVKAVKAVAKKYGHSLTFNEAPVGAAAIDRTGTPLPSETLDLCKSSDAVLFGAIGDPKYDNDPKAKVRPEQGLLAMRKELGLYANIRPVVTWPSLSSLSPLREDIAKGVDLVIVRELTGGLYFGRPQGRSEDGRTAYDTCVYSRHEVERIVRLACDMATKRRGKVTVVDKANVLATSRLWRETALEIAAEFKTVTMDFLFVDNAAMQLIQSPGRFDVVVTENMFGDILSDEASVITGSLGMLPSASTGLLTSVYEPIHGSWPQAAGKNIANPIATILSAAMMFEMSFSLPCEAASIREAVNSVIAEGFLTPDLNSANPKSTVEVGNRIEELILKG